MVEKSDIRKAFYRLATAEGYISSSELAGILQVSERTVRGYVGRLQDYAQKHGCRLNSVRGKGYTLCVEDEKTYEEAIKRLEILHGTAEREGEDVIYLIAREILIREYNDCGGYFTLEELADGMFMSNSSLKKEMPKLREFLASFHLSLHSRSGKGLKLEGEEFYIRLCLLELYENHFWNRTATYENEQFERCFFGCNDQAQIRKVVLNILREKEYKIFDAFANRIVDYMILTRNRISAKKNACFPEIDKVYLQGEGYRLAEKLENVISNIMEVNFSEDERYGILIMLLIGRDWNDIGELSDLDEGLYRKAESMTQYLEEYFRIKWGISFSACAEDYKEYMIPCLFGILIQEKFLCNEIRYIGSPVTKNKIEKSPLSLLFAQYAARVLHEKYQIAFNEYATQRIGVCIYWVISQVPYPYKKRRILIAAKSGMRGAMTLEKNISKNLGTWWIERVQLCELYEARKYETEDYDCLIGTFERFGYRYEWPYAAVDLVTGRQDYENIRNQVILPGYELEKVLEQYGWDAIQVHKHFKSNSVRGVIQLIAYQWGKDQSTKEQMFRMFADCVHRQVFNGILILMADAGCTQKNILEIYQLDKMAWYRNQKLEAILFISFYVDNQGCVARLVENMVRALISSYSDIKDDLTPENIMEKMIGLIRSEMI